VPKGVVAVSQDDVLSISRLVDINLEGLAMIEPASGGLTNDLIELDILAMHEEEGKDLYLSSIKARVISEKVVRGDTLNSSTDQKRYGLQFNDLSSNQYDALKRFISWHSAAS